MASSNDVTLPATKRSRKSIGPHLDMSRVMDKENATIDVATTLAASRRKARSKSIGPGGIESLRQGHGNRRASLAAPPNPPRSILKPTIAPLPEIPPLKKNNRKSLSAAGSANARGDGASAPDLGGSKIALKTEEEQQAAAREREERERRDARRKSLANRRVSFAAEATLHTFHEIEEMNDASKAKGNETTSADAQAARRRSSLVSQSGFNSVEDDTAISMYSSDSEPADAVEEIPADEEEEEEEEDSNSDLDDGTMVSVVTEENTGTTMGFDDSGDEIDEAEETSTLDEALRIAARRAATNQNDEESDDGEEIIPSFGWAKKPSQSTAAPIKQAAPLPDPDQDVHDEDEEAQVDMDMDMDMDVDMEMEMTRPMGKILRNHAENRLEEEEEQEMTMEVTRAMGGILPQKRDGLADDVPDDPMEEATMEFTTAIGGIHRHQSSAVDDLDDDDGNEEMSMELTTVMGGLLKAKRELARRRQSEAVRMEDATMDMTVGLGRIISKARQDADEERDGDVAMDHNTMGMDLTMAVGGIIEEKAPRPQPSEDDWLLGNEPDKGQDAGPRPGKVASPASKPSAEKETPQKPASPGFFAAGLQALRRSITSPFATSPGDGAKTPSGSPLKQISKLATPVQALKPAGVDETPQSSPIRTPPSGTKEKARRRSTSRTPSPAKPVENFRRSFFRPGPESGMQSSLVLTPPKKKTPTQGASANQEGFGSPQVAAIFERRASLVDSASKFVPGKRTVGFADPKELMQEVEREDREEQENLQNSPTRNAGGSPDKDATLNLREMIDSMSPKRNPLKGRKSLHVGSARGLLGKRPQELDDEEAEESDGVKRLKGHQGSPVKNIRLQQPPSKEETTGGLLNPFQRSITKAGTIPRLSLPATPSGEARGQAVVGGGPPMENEGGNDEPMVDDGSSQPANAGGQQKIHLQDFLNMTSIRFMELTTTKRRPTMMPAAFHQGELGDEDDMSLERCVVAGACTVPMLELYQHSCRELKKYISEGRKIVKEIETETFEENPMLFQEYMAATPDVKALMDNQFKNVKTHARHLSKAMWYEWRMKLQDGLKEGLTSIAEGMDGDEKLLAQQEDLLASVIPELTRRHEGLQKESRRLEEIAKEMAESDPAELQAARDELVALDDDITQKQALIAKLRKELEETDAEVEELAGQKQQCLGDIKEAESIREECRGWTCTEVNSFKDRVDAIEKKHGWTVTGISGSILSMTYKREIELVLDATSFQPGGTPSRIDLWYIGDRREHRPQPKTVEREFFLQCIRDHVRALPQGRTRLSSVLARVGRAWDKARLVSRHVEGINASFPTRVAKTSDASIAVTSSLLLRPLGTRVEITLRLSARQGDGAGVGVGVGDGDGDGVEVDVASEARVVYGEQFNEGKVGEFLAARIGGVVGAGEEWSGVVTELHGKLIARGRK